MGPDETPRPPSRSVDGPSHGEPAPPPVPRGATSGPPLGPPLGPPHVGATIGPAPRRGASPRAEGRSRGRGGVRTLGVALAVTLGFVAGALTAERIDLPLPERDRTPSDIEQDVAMVALLEDVVRTEGVMLAFNDVVEELFEGSSDGADALALLARAAASGVGGLEALRPLIVAREGGAAVDEVRSVYLPHLDSWIDYLSAIADEPVLMLTRDDQQPFILRINATAEAFRIALEDLLAQPSSARAAELAERILDDGFRGEGPEPTV